RRFLREREALVAATEADPAARWNHPSWWIARLQQDHPAQWQQILEANNRQPPLSLRVNARRAQRAELQQRLADAGLPSQPAGDQGLVLARPRPVDEIPGFAEGLLSVQDLGAQMAAPLLLEGLDRQAPLRILDACAAPGGKTAHLLESAAHAQVTALDIDPVRCERIQDNLRRLGLQAQVLAADAARPQDWWDGRLFDAILLDAPCTASGIVRRHPDVRWLRRPSDLDQLAAQQARLLDALWPLLQPGGRLLYCTCSVFRAEGEARMQTFVTHNKDASQRPAPGHLIPQIGAKPDGVPDNPEGDHDGFYYGLLEKKQVADGRNQGASREGGVA
ncbi:MAG TPA: 16S rRNA (cytosine(967)-C(5))-methyltransferase RsmB, partial [Ramlibacter sp.]|nr:16S rRNA (cytosine(967)-C(5))-methyltransferase RsmB [Ramlibacter sp.]